MNFKKMPSVLMPDEIVEISFKRAKKESRGLSGKIPRTLRVKRSEAAKVKSVSSFITKHFGKVLKRTSELKNLDPFYQDLVDLIVGDKELDRSLESLKWAIETVKKLEKRALKYIRRSRKNEDIVRARKEFYGKVVSVLKKGERDVELLNSVIKKVRKLPAVESSFTVVVAGMPNVGKSTFVRCITRAKPRVESYPFTTQAILLGHFEKDHIRYQVVDTPGLLDRSIDRRNKVEKQAILALRHLADIILYLFDLSETCGFPIEEQLNLFEEISDVFNMDVVPILNKSDLVDEKIFSNFSEKIKGDIFLCSSLKKEGIGEIVDVITKEGTKLENQIEQLS